MQRSVWSDLWVIQQDDSTTLQSIYSMQWWWPLQRRRNKICWRIVKYMLSDFLEILILGKKRTTWYFMVSKQARTIHHKNWPRPVTTAWNRLISYIFHFTSEYKQYFHVKIHLGWTLCFFFFGSHTFVPLSRMCQKQTAVPHSSTESEIISLDTGLRLDGFAHSGTLELLLNLFLEIFPVFQINGGDLIVILINTTSLIIKSMWWKDIDAILSNVQSARQEALLYVFWGQWSCDQDEY